MKRVAIGPGSGRCIESPSTAERSRRKRPFRRAESTRPFNEKKKNEQLRAHAHLKMHEVAYFLQRLDSPDCREPNGKTILENSMITISTESGDGRHNDVKGELSGVFRAITGAGGRFKTGQIMDVASEGIDVDNTMLDVMGASERLGPEGREGRPVDSIRA